ncbi:hypothetical protein BDZ97DRAFT_1828817 [Flammula alnicola]|nr:hypothetical protein BDZ97DRAFT_1828817 [Flammula alnicola]
MHRSGYWRCPPNYCTSRFTRSNRILSTQYSTFKLIKRSNVHIAWQEHLESWFLHTKDRLLDVFRVILYNLCEQNNQLQHTRIDSYWRIFRVLLNYPSTREERP